MQPITIINRTIALTIILLLGLTSVFTNADTKHRHHVRFLSKLTDDKKGYSLYVATFKPKKFKITVNGHKIRDGQSLNIEVVNNRFLIRYDYEFNFAFQTFAGYREVEFEIEPERDDYEIDFSWKHENRFIIKHATFIRITKIHEPGSEHAR